MKGLVSKIGIAQNVVDFDALNTCSNGEIVLPVWALVVP